MRDFRLGMLTGAAIALGIALVVSTFTICHLEKPYEVINGPKFDVGDVVIAAVDGRRGMVIDFFRHKDTWQYKVSIPVDDDRNESYRICYAYECMLIPSVEVYEEGGE